MIDKLEKNKFYMLAIILVIALIAYSFFQFYRETFSYTKDYYKIKENCYEKKDLNYEQCSYFINDDHLNSYIKNVNPQDLYKKYDAITLTSTIVENTVFSNLQFFSPLLIAIAVLGTIHSEFSSGMFENYLLRMGYRKYLKKSYKIAIKSSLITPCSLVLIFLLASIFSGFNFDTSQVDTELSVYSTFKYSHFFIYGSVICTIQFFISLLYSNICLYCCKKNKNKLVAILMSYLAFLIVNIFIQIVLYIFIINKMLGFKELSDYFNITGYWFFRESNCFIPLLISFILQLISFLVLFYSYHNKEQVIIEYEKQVS